MNRMMALAKQVNDKKAGQGGMQLAVDDGRGGTLSPEPSAPSASKGGPQGVFLGSHRPEANDKDATTSVKNDRLV